ncbi:hypothetical protein MFLO_16229, partial [Listeria floridensis FSL S10-1187]
MVKTSDKATTVVVQTELSAPTINGVTSSDTSISGKAEPNAVVTVAIEQAGGGYRNWEGTSDSNGNYSITIPKQAVGTKIEVTAEKGGLTSPKATTTVTQGALATPTINSVTDKDTVISGTADPNATIVLAVEQAGGGYRNWEGTSDSNGNYSITIPKQAAGTKIEVTAEKGGLTSPKATTTVIQTELSEPTINEITDQTTAVTGVTEPNADVKVRIAMPSGGILNWDGKADANGNYSVTIPKQVAGTEVQVIASL